LKTEGGIQLDLSIEASGPGILLRLLEFEAALGEIEYIHLINIHLNIDLFN
jgi:hypothetical protein